MVLHVQSLTPPNRIRPPRYVAHMPAHTDPASHRAYKERKVAESERIPCGCGCGELMPSIKMNGTPRRFINGHFTVEHASEAGKRSAGVKRRKRPASPLPKCPVCGGPRSRDAKRCRRCNANARRMITPARQCPVCGTTMFRDKMEARDRFLRRKTCSPKCASALKAAASRRDTPRPGADSKWTLSRYARRHLKAACERCGSTERLEAHHRDGDRRNNTAENIETVCKSCHVQGHHAEARASRVH